MRLSLFALLVALPLACAVDPPPACSFEADFCSWDPGSEDVFNPGVFSTGGDFGWSDDKGGTPSKSSTGPLVDHTLGTAYGYYMFIETSNTPIPRVEGDVAYAVSPAFEGGGTVTFWYHCRGLHIGELAVDHQCPTSSGASVWSAASIVCNSNLGSDWHEYSYDLGACVGKQTKLRLKGVRGSGYKGDIAVDDISYVPAPPPIEPVPCGAGNYSASGFEPCSSCADGLTSVGRAVSCNVSCDTGHLAGSCCGAGTALNVTSAACGPCSAGTYAARGSAVCTACPAFHSCPAESGSAADCFAAPSCNFDGDDAICGWNAAAAGDDFDWTRLSGSTPSGYSGPDVDHTTGTSTGHYMYIEGNPSSVALSIGDFATFVSPTFQGGGTLALWFHCYGNDVGMLDLMLEFPAFSGSWLKQQRLCDGTIKSGSDGPYYRDSNDKWVAATADLALYRGSAIRLLFNATIGFHLYNNVPETALLGDVAVDDVSYSPPCGENTFSTTGNTPCSPCPDGLLSVIGSAACVTDCSSGQCCGAGFYNDGGSACVGCPVGTFSNAGSSACLPCSEGSTNFAAASAACTCVENYVSETGTAPCFRCPDNYTSSASAGTECVFDERVPLCILFHSLDNWNTNISLLHGDGKEDIVRYQQGCLDPFHPTGNPCTTATNSLVTRYWWFGVSCYGQSGVSFPYQKVTEIVLGPDFTSIPFLGGTLPEEIGQLQSLNR